MRAMMRRRLLAVASSLLFLASAAQADIHSDKLAIQNVYNQSDAAASANNANGALARFGDPQLRQYEAQTLGSLLAIARSPAFSTQIIAITRPGRNGNEAVVVVDQKFRAFVTRPQGGGIELIAYEAKLREYWVRMGSKWFTERTRMLNVTRTLNGKPVSQW
jgi:hypothetical protein